MFRVKICGLTRPEDAMQACAAGADALGLNFYAPSPRSVSIGQAQSIAAQAADETLLVGVFVNPKLAELSKTCEQVPLAAIQLHGDEPPEFLRDLPPLLVLRAFRCGAAGLDPLYLYLERCEELGIRLAGVLIDAQAPGMFGGSGQTVDWSMLPAARQKLHGLPLILAGGLTPSNVAEAIAIAKPDGVDVASGVETSPGVKDAALVTQFIASARAALPG